MKMDRHHLLEIILWPNEDGTFREIRNSRARLKELGIYDDWKMCIKIPHGEHISLHQKGIYADGELEETATHKKFLLVRQEGKCMVRKKPG